MSEYKPKPRQKRVVVIDADFIGVHLFYQEQFRIKGIETVPYLELSKAQRILKAGWRNELSWIDAVVVDAQLPDASLRKVCFFITRLYLLQASLPSAIHIFGTASDAKMITAMDKAGCSMVLPDKTLIPAALFSALGI